MKAVQQWVWAWGALSVITAMAIAVGVDVIGQMLRQGQDAWAVGFSLVIYAAVCWAGKEWGK